MHLESALQALRMALVSWSQVSLQHVALVQNGVVIDLEVDTHGSDRLNAPKLNILCHFH
jgi:hypothetical protein